MSPRAACRLTQLGFAPVYDYTLGKVDWIAAGLPTHRAGQPSRRVLGGQRTVAGILRAGRISASEQAPAAEVMQPGPATVRAHEDLDATRQRMNEHHVAHLLVTTPDGTLIGVVDAADS